VNGAVPTDQDPSPSLGYRTIMKRFLALIAAALLIPAMSGCSSSAADTSSSAAAGPTGGQGLTDNVWLLTAASISSVDLPKYAMTIEFIEPNVSGFSGVNRYMGSYTSTPEGALTFDPLASTLMAGPQDAMDAEQAYLGALGTVTGYSVTNSELNLFAGPSPILTYTIDVSASETANTGS
jgi:heat shock protein HslJ